VNLRGYDPEQPVPPVAALAGFLRALGMSGRDVPLELDERAAQYRSLLAGRRLLVVLDNAGSADQVRPLLPGTGGCVAVVTSRDALTGLVARDGARRIELDALPEPEAAALLRTLIGLPAEADPDSTAALARHCAGLPLALRVAAERAVATGGADPPGRPLPLWHDRGNLSLVSDLASPPRPPLGPAADVARVRWFRGRPAVAGHGANEPGTDRCPRRRARFAQAGRPPRCDGFHLPGDRRASVRRADRPHRGVQIRDRPR
jgi:hypothetical protein